MESPMKSPEPVRRIRRPRLPTLIQRKPRNLVWNCYRSQPSCFFFDRGVLLQAFSPVSESEWSTKWPCRYSFVTLGRNHKLSFEPRITIRYAISPDNLHFLVDSPDSADFCL
uniref:Uncharacterized protein n=1 Tax=Coccidioides posadasii RMSCC 3488 TaxID=454284 RepID=A0A0J6IN39_COCPO|nr:hypothetical protein CPAG_09626 [Coccidioides posadasii RMSCC 3488]